jgi:hypothetical protein
VGLYFWKFVHFELRCLLCLDFVQTKYSYLDVVGRTVLVLENKNVVPEHITPFQVICTSLEHQCVTALVSQF